MNDDAPAWLNLLDDNANAVARLIAQVLPIPIRELGPEHARALLNTAPTADPITPLDNVEQLTVPTRAGAIRARLYRAEGVDCNSPALVYMHGGDRATQLVGTLEGS